MNQRVMEISTVKTYVLGAVLLVSAYAGAQSAGTTALPAGAQPAGTMAQPAAATAQGPTSRTPKPKNVLLDQAFWQGKPTVEAVKAEIAKGADPAEFNGNAFDPVVMAINSGAPNETIKYLLEQPGNTVTKITHDGRVYMHWAAYRNNPEIMKVLLAKGGKTAVDDAHGFSVMNFAANAGAGIEVYELCLANGSDPRKEMTREGANALLLAVSSDSTGKITDYLVSKGLSLKSTDNEGNTAFNYAARSGKVPVMRSLYAKGIRPTENVMIMAAQGEAGRRSRPSNIWSRSG